MIETETITIEPNYNKIFKSFLCDAMHHQELFARPRRKTFERKEVYDFIASFRIALGSITKQEELVELQTQFDTAAEKIYEQLMKEMLEEENE